LHPLSKYIDDNAAKRQAIRPGLREADFGKFPEEYLGWRGEGVAVKEVKKESPEMPCQNTGSVVR
jgi:hypothetical protein